MSRPAPPALTVRYDGSTRTFAPGNDVVIGRDLRADVRIAHPLISRAHLVLRFDQGRWVAIDNGSLNGMYANGRRVPAIDIHDGQQINIGNPDGPGLTFEVGRHQGSVGTPPQTTSVPLASRPTRTRHRQRRVRRARLARSRCIRRAHSRDTRRSAGLSEQPVGVCAEHAAAGPPDPGGSADLLPRSGIGHPDGTDGRTPFE